MLEVETRQQATTIYTLLGLGLVCAIHCGHGDDKKADNIPK
jgi:hypothetical protein